MKEQVFDKTLDGLLASGGDSRLLINPSSNTNTYRCTSSPRARIVQLGSCTASTITQSGYDTAQKVLNRLRAVNGSEYLASTINECYRQLRGELRHLLTRGIVNNLHVILTPSGTDAELVPALLAAGDRSRPLCNIVIGSSELGSGTKLAAGCRYFDELTPSGRRVSPGGAIDEELARLISVHDVLIRDNAGAARAVEEIDAEVTNVVTRRVANGERVLLHVTAHNKTGAHAPSLGVVQQLKKQFPDQIDVVVDAAQGRFSRRGLIQILELGYMVIITGSKFYGGPTFAGTVLIPDSCSFERKKVPNLPPGYGEFLTQPQLPTSWAALRQGLPVQGNIGLLLRWSASIQEMHNYYAIPSHLRLAALRAFESLLPAIFDGSNTVHLDTVPTPIISDNYERLLQSKTTVFSFRVWNQASEHYFSQAELRRMFHWMDTDLSWTIPDASAEERRALAGCMQIGQPVKLNSGDETEIAVLRIANGGVLISQVAENLAIGDTLEHRIGWLEDKLIVTKRKIETAAHYYPQICSALEARD